MGSTSRRRTPSSAHGRTASSSPSPTPTHAQLITRCVHQDIPAFCEKPMDSTIPTTAAIVQLVERSDVPVSIGFQRRRDSRYLALREAMRSGELSALFLARMVVGDETPPPAPEYLAVSGGIANDQSVHDFDVLRFLTDAEIVEICSTGARLSGAPGFAEANDFDHAATMMRLSNGALAVLTSSRNSAPGYDVHVELTGSLRTLGVGCESSTVLEEGSLWTAHSPYRSGFIHAFAEAYRQEMAEFLDVVEREGSPSCTPRDALAAAITVEAAQRSQRSGGWVRVADTSEVF